MTESKICTCPSGDGSLRHPCPAHPAVEQAGGDERAAFEVWASALGWKLSPDQNNCGIVVAERYGHPGVQRCWEAWQARAALAQPSPAQAEAERPEVVARVVHSNPVVLGQCGPLNANDELMTVAQHAASVARWAEMFNRVEQQRDAALARVAELERQEPVALANRGLHAFWVKWTEAAAGLYGPGIKLYAAPVAQAQHSVPEGFIGRLSEFLAQRGTTGKALLRELRAMLAAAPAQGGE